MAFKLPNSRIKSAITITGYKSNSKDVNNDVNIVPGNQITMKGVDFDVKGVGSNGVTKHMKPGKDYDFGDAEYVVESPLKHCGCAAKLGPNDIGPPDTSYYGKSPLKQSNKRTKGKGRHFRKSEEGAGMTAAGVASYRKQNPGSKLKTAVTGKVKAGSKAAKRRKAFCARSKSWTGERGKAARRRWKC